MRRLHADTSDSRVRRLASTNGAATVSAPPRPVIVTGPPPEFGGDPEAWSPEHVLLAAVSGCLWSTFRALAARKGVAVRRMQCVELPVVVDSVVTIVQLGSAAAEVCLAIRVTTNGRAPSMLSRRDPDR